MDTIDLIHGLLLSGESPDQTRQRIRKALLAKHDLDHPSSKVNHYVALRLIQRLYEDRPLNADENSLY